MYLGDFPSYEGDTITSRNSNISKKPKNTTKNDKTFTSHLKTFDYDSSKNKNKDAISPNVIDILIVYNEQAKIEAGGSATDPNDTLQIEQKIIAEVDNLNVALENSKNTTRATRFHVAKLNDFTHGVGEAGTLDKFRNLNSVNILRNQVGADLVSGIINTNFSNFNACGLAYGHTAEPAPPEGAWTIGVGFSEYAYNIISQACMLYDFTFAHEFGHLLGAHHARDEKGMDELLADILNNGYNYPFAWRNGGFKSVLSITVPTPERRLNFSNPQVNFGGTTIATGVEDVAHNQKIIDNLVASATNYRQRPDLIFKSDFE